MFSSLTAMYLSGVVFEEWSDSPQREGAEYFVTRHGSTLTSLELSEFGIAIGAGDGAPRRLWADVWSRFADTLTSLTEIKVTYLPVSRSRLP
jgi:hypothetical protein